MVDRRVDHLPLPGGAPASKKGGSLPPPTPLPCGAPGEAGTRGAQPCYALSQGTWGILANPLPKRILRQRLHHSGEGYAL